MDRVGGREHPESVCGGGLVEYAANEEGAIVHELRRGRVDGTDGRASSRDGVILCVLDQRVEAVDGQWKSGRWDFARKSPSSATAR